MKKIADLTYLQNARNAEHYTLYLQILKIVTDDFVKKYSLTPLRNSLATAFEEEDDAYLQTQAFVDTEEIYKKDAVSDQHFRYIYLSVQSKKLSPVEAEALAAKKVAFGIEIYAGAATKPFGENIAMVEDMVKKLQSPDYAPAIKTLGLTEAVAALKVANDEFVAAFSRRADEKRVRSISDNLKKIRPQVDEAARKLFEAINALYLVNELVEKDVAKSAEIGGVIDAVNAQIVQFSETLSRRGAGKKAKVEPDDKPDITDPTPTPPDQGGGDRPEIE